MKIIRRGVMAATFGLGYVCLQRLSGDAGTLFVYYNLGLLTLWALSFAPKLTRSSLIIAVLPFAVLTPAKAYTLEGASYAYPGTIPFYVNLGAYDTAAAAACAQWNNFTGPTHLLAINTTDTNFGFLDGRNEIVWSNNSNASEVAFFNSNPNVFAAALIHGSNGTMLESDIVVNSNFNWGTYDGPLQSEYDIGRILLHELGHCLGLGHSTPDSIMGSPTGFWTLQADDIAGARAIYTQPAGVPETGSAAALLGLGLIGLMGYRYAKN